MFQSFGWNRVAARVFADREAPHVIYAEDDGGAALIPAAVRPSQLTLLGESMFDYRDLLVEGDGTALQAAWSKASELGLNFDAGALREDGNIAAWNHFQRHSFYGAPQVSSRKITAGAFAAEHHRLPRWRRRLEREGIPLRVHTGADSALVRQIYDKKGRQPAEAGDSLFHDPRRVDFMVEVCAEVGAACEIFTYETAGSLVASLVTFRDGHFRRFYTVQFDPAWAKYSPGMVLIYEVTRRSLEHGLDCDYMTGQHAYKMRFATSVVPMYWLQASAATLRGFECPRPATAA